MRAQRRAKLSRQKNRQKNLKIPGLYICNNLCSLFALVLFFLRPAPLTQPHHSIIAFCGCTCVCFFLTPRPPIGTGSPCTFGALLCHCLFCPLFTHALFFCTPHPLTQPHHSVIALCVCSFAWLAPPHRAIPDLASCHCYNSAYMALPCLKLPCHYLPCLSLPCIASPLVLAVALLCSNAFGDSLPANFFMTIPLQGACFDMPNTLRQK